MFQMRNLFASVSYRYPMLVRELKIFPCTIPEDSYYVCPRCRVTLDREFVKYCDRCGQCLDWSKWDNPTIIYSRKKN